MKNAKLMAALFAFCKAEHSDENILFYQLRGNDYKKIFKDYLKKGAPKEINLPAAVMKPIRDLGDADNFDDKAWPGLMKDAKVEIRKLMERDTLVRFARSDQLKAYFIAEVLPGLRAADLAGLMATHIDGVA